MTPHSAYRLPRKHKHLKKKFKSIKAFCGDERLEQGSINIQQTDVYIYSKTLSNRMPI